MQKTSTKVDVQISMTLVDTYQLTTEGDQDGSLNDKHDNELLQKNISEHVSEKRAAMLEITPNKDNLSYLIMQSPD